jgi:hypothetical protein
MAVGGRRSAGDLRCARCGYGSGHGEFFRLEPDGLFARSRTFCAACQPYRASWREHASLWAPPLLIAQGIGFIALGEDIAEVGLGLLLLGLMSLCHLVTMVVHELGHAGIARALGMRVLRISIGSGPVLASRRILGTAIVLRRFPFLEGHTLCYDPTPAPAKWHWALMLLGGVGANLAVLALGLSCWAVLAPGLDILDLDLGFAIVAQAFLGSQLLAAANLVPRSARISLGRWPSDGLQLLSLLAAKHYPRHAVAHRLRLRIRAFLDEQQWEEARRHGEAAWRISPDDAGQLALLIEATGASLGPHAALERLFRAQPLLIDGADPTAPSLARAAIAWQALLTDDRAFLALAELLSRQALDALPERPELRAVRGGVLARLGSPDGRTLLLQGLREMEPAPAKAKFARFLARLDGAQGDAAAADDWENLAAFLADGRPPRYRSSQGRLLSSQATSSSCVSSGPSSWQR